MDEQELKALQIAAKAKLTQQGDTWLVPSQSGHGKYTVNPDPKEPHCTCPDYEARHLRCKHIFAVEYTIQREQTSDGQTIVTESVRITQKTYSQDWPAYNAAQVNEKDQFQTLLHELCKGIGGPSQKMGRPRLSLEDERWIPSNHCISRYQINTVCSQQAKWRKAQRFCGCFPPNPDQDNFLDTAYPNFELSTMLLA